MLPTHHERTTCKLVLICPECCDKRGIDDLNAMACKRCQTKDASIGLTQPSDNVALTANSESVEVEILQGNNNLDLSVAVNGSAIIQAANENPLIDIVTTDSGSQDISSADSSTNAQGQKFMQRSNGSFMCSVSAPNMRTFMNTPESALAEGHDSDGEIVPFYDAVQHEEKFVEEPLCCILPNEPKVPPKPEEPPENSIPSIDADAVKKMTGMQLQQALVDRKLTKCGKKWILLID